jgi:acyl CoA:acetate/3-ketoacid CoA transferase
MDFKPLISKDLKLMPLAIFEETWGGLKDIMKV